MITTLAALVIVCLLSLVFILIIPYFAATKTIASFLPQDIREAAKGSQGTCSRLWRWRDTLAHSSFSARTDYGAATASGCCSVGSCCSCTATSCSIFWCRTSIL